MSFDKTVKSCYQMKKIVLLYLLPTLTVFGQTAALDGITLTYHKAQDRLILVMPEKRFQCPSYDYEVDVSIHKEFSLKANIGGMEYSLSEPFFKIIGNIGEHLYSFETHAGTGIEISKKERYGDGKNISYRFSNVENGEYILEVIVKCDNYVEYKNQTTLVVR